MRHCSKTGKTIFKDKMCANMFIAQRAHEVKLRHYTCPFCGGIHVTHTETNVRNVPLKHADKFKKYLQDARHN